MGGAKEFGGKLGKIRGGCAVELEHRGAGEKAEILDRADVEQRHSGNAELHAGQFHIIENLLYQRVFSGLGRLIYDYVLPFPKQVGKQRYLSLASYEVPPRHGTAKNKRRIHRLRS